LGRPEKTLIKTESPDALTATHIKIWQWNNKRQDTRKYYKCNKIGHIARNCQSE